MLKKYNKIIFFTSLFIIPIIIFFLLLVINNRTNFSALFKGIIYWALVFNIIILFASSIIDKKKIFVKANAGLFSIFFSLLIFSVSAISLVYYDSDFKKWLITTSNESMNYKHLASSIYEENIIDMFLPKKEEEINLVDFTIEYKNNHYFNQFDKEILDREEGAIYKKINISGTTFGSKSHYEGYLIAVYNPKHVKLAKSAGAGVTSAAYGETLSTISRKNNALVAINAGGFLDPNFSSNGGIPRGDIFINGVLDTSFSRGKHGGGLIAFDKNDKLILKRITKEEAVELGVRDSVDWGPFLIVNGKNRYSNTKYYFETGRTVIGQRADGIVLLLVIDGLQEHSKGASFKDLAYIMERYGAINAANLDGGTSTAMTINHKYINSPWNGFRPTFRWIPNAWIVTDK